MDFWRVRKEKDHVASWEEGAFSELDNFLFFILEYFEYYNKRIYILVYIIDNGFCNY